LLMFQSLFKSMAIIRLIYLNTCLIKLFEIKTS